VQTARTNVTQIERLYRQHGSALLLFALSITGERSGAQDAVHQVYLKLLQQGDLRHIADAKAYLFVCVRNAALNDARIRRRDVTLDHISPWFAPPNRDYVGELNLRRALAALPDEQRQVTILHVWCGLTFSQVAGVLDIGLNTAASRYRYALAKLREAICAKEDSCANP
jgi:RNA polymerase sigma factor (sigma-70 family)